MLQSKGNPRVLAESEAAGTNKSFTEIGEALCKRKCFKVKEIHAFWPKAKRQAQTSHLRK